MNIDLLIAEIGSTTTVVNAFNIKPCPQFVGQGQSATTVEEGNVNIGLKNAIKNLSKNLGVENINYHELMATSSAAGGLKMTVHGLVYDMTVKAAKEAALGAGANIKLITAGRLRESDLQKIKDMEPNIILIAGGVDYGERKTALYNSKLIANLGLNIPVIYAGNIESQDEIKDIFKYTNNELYIADNVYPKIDQLNIEPTREIIQDVFEKHIINAEGMEKVKELIDGHIIPTPGAVMKASKILYKNMGNLLTIDIGGATTDIHSVSEDSDEVSRMLLHPEPIAKRSVEGDLGLYINIENIIEMVDKDMILKRLNINLDELNKLIDNCSPIPNTKEEIELIKLLAFYAGQIALYRHVGTLKKIYGPTGKRTIAEGKDLTQVQYVIGTGGALTRLPNSKLILRDIISSPKDKYLLPNKEVNILIDNDYIMASLGVMSIKYPIEALVLMKKSLNF